MYTMHEKKRGAMEHEKKRGATDDLRWYEILFCCCKCRAQCKSCVSTLFVYFIPIILLLALAAVCVVFGVLWRTDCSYETRLPYWVIVSAVTPFLLLASIKAIKEDYYGVTMWRVISFTTYLLFLGGLIVGSIWSFNTWANASSDTCADILRLFAFVLCCVHWLLFVLATIPQVYVVTHMCCCCTDNAIKPLKRSVSMDYHLGD